MSDLNETIALIKLLGYEIQQKEKLGPLGKWRYSDFKNLSIQINKATKIRISHMTLIRIFQVGEFRRSPQRATLDALARYLDYTDWNDFRNVQINENMVEKPAISDSKDFPHSPSFSQQRKDSTDQKEITAKSNKKAFVFMGLVGILFLTTTWLGWTVLFQQEQDFKEVQIECINPEGTVPHRFAFHYKVPGQGYTLALHPRSFEPWSKLNPNKKKQSKGSPLDPQDSIFLTNRWIYPGLYTASIKEEGVILKEIPISLKTEDWTAYISIKPKEKGAQRRRPLIVQALSTQDGHIGLPDSIQIVLDNMLLDHRIETNFFMSLDSGLDANCMSFEVALKNTTHETWIFCKYQRVSLLTTRGMIEIPIIQQGCPQHQLMIFGDRWNSFKKGDKLMNHETSGNKWDTLKIDVKQYKGFVYRNDTLVETVPYSYNLGQLNTLRFKFNGLGSLDYVRIKDSTGKVFFEDEF